MTLCPPFLTPWAIYSRCPAACEHDGCGKDAGWGFARPKQAPHWFCFEHGAEGEKLCEQPASKPVG